MVFKKFSKVRCSTGPLLVRIRRTRAAGYGGGQFFVGAAGKAV